MHNSARTLPKFTTKQLAQHEQAENAAYADPVARHDWMINTDIDMMNKSVTVNSAAKTGDASAAADAPMCR